MPAKAKLKGTFICYTFFKHKRGNELSTLLSTFYNILPELLTVVDHQASPELTNLTWEVSLFFRCICNDSSMC